MDVNKETQPMNMKRERVGDLLKKINHAVRSSQHFRSSLSSLINTNTNTNMHISAATDMPVTDRRTKKNSGSTSNSKRGGAISSSQGDHDHSSKSLQRSSTIFSTTPDLDGYLWRKYGEKKIARSKFPRCYYRCTYYKEQKCNATKQVQQCTDDSDSPMYKVTYFSEHTCTCTCRDDSYSNATDAINSCQKMLEFSATEFSSTNGNDSLAQQLLLAPSPRDASVASSSINNNTEMLHGGWTDFERVETDLTSYESYDMDELLSDYMSDL